MGWAVYFMFGSSVWYVCTVCFYRHGCGFNGNCTLHCFVVPAMSGKSLESTILWLFYYFMVVLIASLTYWLQQLSDQPVSSCFHLSLQLEWFCVLRPGGILMISVPDLETLARYVCSLYSLCAVNFVDAR